MSSKLGLKLKVARKSKGMSQAALGKMLNLSDKAVSSYEVGRATPTLEVLQEISKITYKPITYFIDDVEAEEVQLREKLDIIERELSEVKRLLAQHDRVVAHVNGRKGK